MKTLLITILILVLCASGGWYLMSGYFSPAPAGFRTEKLRRGELTSVIISTGTIEPEDVVDVGAQVAGQIARLGRDPSDEKKSIDYGSRIHEGTVLAEIDPSIYQAQVEQAEAALTRAQADLKQSQARVDQSKREWERAQKMIALPNKAISDTEHDLAEANFKAAQATVSISEATIKQNEAALRLARRNLDYTTIKSPVEGVIIDRRVNVGQTVVASLNAPSLFLIAKDLRHLQVWASVNEADIGRVKLGMPVRFTVDAYPNRTFTGSVVQVRLNATMTQNVVTYTVVVGTENADEALKPYMTANLRFELERVEDAWLAPNGALRYKPRPAQVVADQREAFEASLNQKSRRPGEARGEGRSEGGGESRRRRESAGESGKNDSGGEKTNTWQKEKGRLWVREGDLLRFLEVKLGATDGAQTVVAGEGLAEDLELVLGEEKAAAAGSTETNPFAPKMFGPKR